MFVCIIGNKDVDRCFSLDLVNAVNDVDVWISTLCSVVICDEFAICSLIIGPLILIGTMPLCLGGIFSVDLTVPIVAFCLQFLVCVKNLPSF